MPVDAIEGFVVDLEGFEGPLDLLLELARAQRVDLKRISILALAEQYLGYLQGARAARLEIAAEYLVMAAWLAYLKSQLLLPVLERASDDAEAIAQALTERLRRLEAIRRAVELLQGRPQLGRERLARGVEESMPVKVEPRYRASLSELLAAYGRLKARRTPDGLRLPQRALLTVDAAMERIARLLSGHDWREFRAFLPSGLSAGLAHRAAVAASLVASLELARQGLIEVQQAAPFGPIMVRRRG